MNVPGRLKVGTTAVALDYLKCKRGMVVAENISFLSEISNVLLLEYNT